MKENPDHDIFSEEEGKAGKNSDYGWVIDPLDGTRNFILGLPIYCVSIALRYKEEVVLGVVYNPNTKTLFHALKGGGAWNGKSRYLFHVRRS